MEAIDIAIPLSLSLQRIVCDHCAHRQMHTSTEHKWSPERWDHRVARMTNTNGEMDLIPDIIVSAKHDGASKQGR